MNDNIEHKIDPEYEINQGSIEEFSKDMKVYHDKRYKSKTRDDFKRADEFGEFMMHKYNIPREVLSKNYLNVHFIKIRRGLV